MTPGAIVRVYRWVFVTLIAIASVRALVSGSAHPHHALVAMAEIIGAIMLLAERTRLPGVVVLLCVFALAQAISAANGEWPTQYLQYAASALVIALLSRDRSMTSGIP